MNTEHDEFARRHPSLDRALREQIQAPVLDAAFRQQVMARVAAQRAQLADLAASPEKVRSRLRAQLVLQLLNLGAVVLAAVLLVGAVAPQLAAVPGITAAFAAVPSAWMQQTGLVAAVVVSGAALLYGMQRARMLGWLRALDI